MSNAFIGEIRPFANTYAPYGWMDCAGQLLQISQYTPLFAVIGIQYGGNGTTTFALPDLRGRAPLGFGQGAGLNNNYTIGHQYGEEGVQLSQSQMPTHDHTLSTLFEPYTQAPTSFKAAPTAGVSWPSRYLDVTNPSNPVNVIAFAPKATPTPPTQPTSPVAMSVAGVAVAGSSIVHENRQPYQVLRYCICVTGGDFPPRP